MLNAAIYKTDLKMYRNGVPGIHISSQGGDICLVEAIMCKSHASKGKGPWNLTAML